MRPNHEEIQDKATVTGCIRAAKSIVQCNYWMEPPSVRGIQARFITLLTKIKERGLVIPDDAKLIVDRAYEIVNAGIEFLDKMPDSVRRGKIIVHNDGSPTRRLGKYQLRFKEPYRFHAWLANPNSDQYVVCKCRWARELRIHYRVRRPEEKSLQ